MAHVLTYLPKVETLRKWKDEKQVAYQSVVKRDWVPTGRIDFATRLNGNSPDADQPSEFKLLIEERRIVESIAGSENLEMAPNRLPVLGEAVRLRQDPQEDVAALSESLFEGKPKVEG